MQPLALDLARGSGHVDPRRVGVDRQPVAGVGLSQTQRLQLAAIDALGKSAPLNQ
jgi:hypothetical protein